MSNNLYNQPVILGLEHGLQWLPYLCRNGKLTWYEVVDHDSKTLTLDINILEYEE